MKRKEFNRIMKDAIKQNIPFIVIHEIIFGVDMWVIINNKDFEIERNRLLNHFREEEMKNTSQEILDIKIINNIDLLNKLF